MNTFNTINANNKMDIMDTMNAMDAMNVTKGLGTVSDCVRKLSHNVRGAI